MPAGFQQNLDMILHDMPHVHAFIDDILIVTVGSEDEHIKIVDQTLKRLDDANKYVSLTSNTSRRQSKRAEPKRQFLTIALETTLF